MNTEINQKISQFLDDELSPVELDNLLLKIKKQSALKKTMSRYQTMSEVLKKEHVILADTDFLNKIKQQVEQEPHHFLPQQPVKKERGYFWQKTGLALAASVACVAVIMSQQTGFQSPPETQQIIAKNKIEEPAVQQVAKKTKPVQHQRLKAYLQAHNDDLYTHGSLNTHPLARVTGYEQE